MDEQEIYKTVLIKESIKLYEGCGNKVLIILAKNDYAEDDKKLRTILKNLGLKYKADSIMLLKGNPNSILSQNYHVHMDVFDPRGIDSSNPSLAGAWATMCGNGIRAVARYLYDESKINLFISTRSGIRTVTMIPQQQYKVDMGNFTMDKSHLNKYAKGNNLLNLIPQQYQPLIHEIIVGLNGTKRDEIIDGEPHLILFIDEKFGEEINIIDLAQKIGPKITNNRSTFPECINTNLALIRQKQGDSVIVSACTYERGVDYVTKACGTGATVIGSYLLTTENELKLVEVQMPGGTLIIDRGPNNTFFMTGPANPVL